LKIGPGVERSLRARAGALLGRLRGGLRAALLLAILTGAFTALAQALVDLPFPEPERRLAAAGAVIGALAAALAVAIWRHSSLARLSALQALRAARGFQARALSQLNEAVVATDASFAIHTWNRAAEQVYGWSAEEVLGRKVGEVMVSRLPGGGGTADLLAEIRARSQAGVALQRRRKDGRWIDVELSVTAVEDEAGKVVGFLGVHRDVTEARRLRERLDKAERLASMGTLAAGMAHEVSNPLAVVLSGLDFAVREVSGKADLAEAGQALAEAREAAGRVARLVRELQALSSRGEGVRRIDLRQAVQAALSLVPEASRLGARLELHLGEVPPVEAAPKPLERVLVHLLGNAFGAMPAEGAGAGAVGAATRTAADGRAVVEIRGDGRGLPPDPLRRAGLEGASPGLSVCRGLVAAMAGELEVERAEDGPTFRLLLPAAPEAPPA
jgi:PAS domain S-box-containing protein